VHLFATDQSKPPFCKVPVHLQVDEPVVEFVDPETHCVHDTSFGRVEKYPAAQLVHVLSELTVQSALTLVPAGHVAHV
jgi:hypothetical protein